MGAYIKGMEMPTTCGKCQIKNAIECNRWKLVRSVALDRHRDCPLVPVPPHGRLIDADALSQMFDPDESFGAAVLEIIVDTPTIIPAEEDET